MIALACDHGGYVLKEEIKKYLTERQIAFLEFGSQTGEACDYPIVARDACEAVTSGKCEKAILCCGTGIGMSIAANKVNGIRAACCSDYFSAKFTRLHNDANALCLGGRVLGAGLAIELVEIFLTTEFEGGRHARRVSQISELEN